MKLIRYESAGSVEYGTMEGDRIVPLDGEFPSFAPGARARAIPLGEVRLLAPVQPSKIIAIGPGYKAHLHGAPMPERPRFWIKPENTLTQPGDPIVLPPQIYGREDINHEAELAIVIGRKAHRVSIDEASSHIYGYTCINDVTVGNMKNPEEFIASMAFVDGKIYDSFAPLGPHIETELDTSDLRIRCSVNGQPRQDHPTSDRIWSCFELVSLVSQVMTLNPGDIIATGSPPGAGPIHPGDTVEIEIEGLGVLSNPVVLG